MRVKLLYDIPGHKAGQIVEVVSNWQRLPAAPRWLTADDYPIGVFSQEAEELQDCGHSVSSIVSTDEGTHYCWECEATA